MIILKSPREIMRMKAPGKIVAEILERLKCEVRPGVTSIYLNNLAEELAKKKNAKPAFKGYSGYPFSLCCSINEQVVHGFPSERVLISGDIISIDFGVVYKGFYGDAAVTIPVGDIDENSRRLIQVTEECLYKAIEQTWSGRRLNDISFAVENHAIKNGFSVVREFVGHGIGRNLHESPQVPNFGVPGQGIKLKPGMVLAIEPMINEKGHEVRILSDGWTAIAADGGRSAHFEHTVAVTEGGPVILTKI